MIERVNNAAVQAGRDPSEITLVAATKMNDAERVQAAIEAGIRVCGENRVQELQEKYEQNAYDGADLQFIGTLQTNKVKYLIGKVSLIQSVGSVHLGEAIAKEAEKRGVCQDILLEVNIGREAAKSGLPPEELHDAIVKLSAKKSLHIRGLMAIPPVADEKTKNSNYFTEMRQVFIDILTKKYDNVDMDYLSMGMTNDFETAIACGAPEFRPLVSLHTSRFFSSTPIFKRYRDISLAMALEHGSRRHGDLWQTAVSDRFALKHKEELGMGSIKGFIDWVKGSELEDDYEDEMPRQRNEEPAMDSEPSSYNRRSYDRSYDSDAQDAPQVRRHDRSDKVVNINTTTQLAVVLVKPDRFETAVLRMQTKARSRRLQTAPILSHPTMLILWAI